MNPVRIVNKLLRRSALFLVTLACIAAASASAANSRPNFLLVLCDDLGYGDLGCYGNTEITTPNIDRFAAESLRLTDCYASSANCSPSRTGLMTGRTPYRVGVYNWIPMLSPMHVRESEITVATLLRNAGYATCLSGKWHLNGNFNLPGQPQPDDHGFDHWFATQNNCLPNHRNPYNFVRNDIPVGPLEGFAADLVTAEATEWLRNGRDKSKPFFLFVSYHEPHEPIATADWAAKLYPSDDPSRSAHHGNISQMDAAFGRLMAALDSLRLRENTVVFFTSDNGPAITGIHPHGSTGGLREKKGHVYEGGIRVPGILRWPGRTKPGAISDTPVIGVDVLPTFCEIAGVKPPADRAIDGTSILPLLEGRPIERDAPMCWQLNRAASAPKIAMRQGDWKILAKIDKPQLKPSADWLVEEMEAIKTCQLTEFELYNLRDDRAETKDLAKSEPERLEAMASTLRSLHREIQTEGPEWPAWTWPRYESKRIEWPAYRGKKRKPATGGSNSKAPASK